MLVSCHLNKPGDYTPEYLKEASALDAPGTAAARAALRAKLVKEGTFADGETLDVQQGKVYLFDRNPDNDSAARGRMVESATAKIVACEGLYYFVELEDGAKGFLRESDLVNPKRVVSTSDSVMPLEGGLPAGWENMDMGPQPEEVQLDGSQKLMVNEAGRTVVVVSKKSDRGAEFEARKKAMMEGGEGNAQPAPAEDLPTPTEELPEPAGSAE